MIFLVILGLKSAVPSFFPIYGFSFLIKWIRFFFVFLCFFGFLSPTLCFVVNLLRRAVLSLIVGFFVGFHVAVSHGKVSIQ